jgi:tetratricopeptide (TPR) repeat protein
MRWLAIAVIAASAGASGFSTAEASAKVVRGTAPAQVRPKADATTITGITAAPAVARAYDLILDADFDRLAAELPAICGPAPRVACLGLEALSLWWQIQLDPESRALDPAFRAKVDAAIGEAEGMTEAEPNRAEAWFYLGAGYGARAQWRVLREERLSAARDGKRIKVALERALALDPALHDAEFGIGLYRYYADVAPAVLRFLRWLLLLPGGNRVEGLQQLERAATQGQLVNGEAQFQIHVLYLWYEDKSREALDLVRGLQRRYPHNPLFHQIEAEILDGYFHDPGASLAASERLLALARGRAVHRPAAAEIVARLNMARQLRALGRTDHAITQLDAIIAAQPPAPAGALARARRLRREIK